MTAAKSCDVFWIPFKSDCEELLRRFQQAESVRYETFAAIWRDMDFSSVFHGTITRYEKRSFSRLVFVTVYDYFLPPYNFQIRVGALYMLYGLYHTQLTWPKEKIWVALKDWVHVQKFVLDALSSQHLDVIYVYRSLLSEKALFFTAMPKQLVFDAKRRYVNKDINEKFQDPTARVKELVSTDTLEEIGNIQGHYERIKQTMSLSSFISVTPFNLASRLEECAFEFKQWQEKNANMKKKDKEDTEVKENPKQWKSPSRAQVLAMSYGHLPTAPKSRRHRQVEMDTSGSGTDNAHDVSVMSGKRVSLRARTWQTLGKKELEERRQHWLLSSTEKDRAAFKRSQQKNRFKW